VTLRVLEVLRSADLVACEDTRRTGRLLERYGIKARLVSYHEHNERARARELIERMRAGARIALVSDAGMPLVSDPGHELLRASLAAGIEVEVLPGPSSVITALVASALPSEPFCFVGFLPRARAARAELLRSARRTTVAFESPQRLVSTLALLAEEGGGGRVAVCRELTKLHEEVRRGTAEELAEHYREHAPRGEVVLVWAPAPARPVGVGEEAEQRAQAADALRELIAAGAKPRAAAKALARLTGIAANELYAELTGGAE
jgi:16S rRNA (cytidine1402-2'-O)-methyltransferase